MWNLVLDVFGVKGTLCRSMDSIVRPKNINYIRVMILERSIGYGIPKDPSPCTEGKPWHEWVGCSGISVFQRSEHFTVARMKIRWLSSYPDPQVRRNIANLLQLLTSFS